MSVTQRQVDAVDLGTRHSWIDHFVTRWTAGVKFKAPAAGRAALVATLKTTVSRNTSAHATHKLGLEGERGETQLTELWLSAHHGRTQLALRSKLGIKGIHVTFTGGVIPHLSVTGLPPGTFRVTLNTTGSVGTKIFALKSGCSDSAMPMSSVTKITLADGTSHPRSSKDTDVICNGVRKPVN